MTFCSIRFAFFLAKATEVPRLSDRDLRFERLWLGAPLEFLLPIYDAGIVGSTC